MLFVGGYFRKAKKQDYTVAIGMEEMEEEEDYDASEDGPVEIQPPNFWTTIKDWIYGFISKSR